MWIICLLLTLSLSLPGQAGAVRAGEPTPDLAFLARLIAESAAIEGMGQRVGHISGRLRGRPYLAHPLIGSATRPEQLVTRLDAFDCVTFVETVLAIAAAHDPAGFIRQLVGIRYRGGVIDWRQRLHYATAWSEYQVARGLLIDLTTGSLALRVGKLLHLVPGLDPVTASYRYYPRRAFPAIAPALETGDIIFFTSGSTGLDTNHMGIVIRREEQWLLRSASRRRRAVADEPLPDYIARHRMAGFFINRPR